MKYLTLIAAILGTGILAKAEVMPPAFTCIDNQINLQLSFYYSGTEAERSVAILRNLKTNQETVFVSHYQATASESTRLSVH